MYTGSAQVLKRLPAVVAVLLITMGDAGAQPPAAAPSSSPVASQKAAADQAAFDRVRQERARRKEAEARLQQFLINPPDTAPPWMKRQAEQAKAASKKRSAP